MSSELGDSLGFVSLVYVCVLIPWTLLYFHDFISERWYTINHTWKSGVIHLVLTGLPMPFLVAYIILQTNMEEPDYKEMFAAVAALVLSTYHLLRTIWGLVQLRKFGQWAINTAVAMESASYRCILNVSHNETPSESERLQYSQDSPTIIRYLKKLIGINKLIWPKKPKMFDQPDVPPPQRRKRTRFKLHRRRKDEPKGVDRGIASQSKSETETNKEKRARIAAQVYKMKVNNSIIDNEFLGSAAPPLSLSWRRFQLYPYKPETTFVRWAVAYLAQFGKQWLQDSEAVIFDNDSWEYRRHSFASKVWGTAVLRMEVDCLSEARPIQDHKTSNIGQNSLLSPEKWREFLPGRQDQLFDKHEILKSCFAKGDGLPYNWPVLEQRSDQLPSHGLYRPLIKEAVAEIPSSLYDFVEDLDPYQIEWFAIFIGISKWSGSYQHLANSSPSRSSATDFTHPTSRQDLKPSDAPVRILQDQLGFLEPPVLSQCGFPFMKRSYGKYLWDNRGILQVSARIDNWLALSNGDQFEFLPANQSEPHLDNGTSDTNNRHTDGTGKEEHDAEDEDAEAFCNFLKRSQRVFEAHRELEQRRLRYQLADSNTRHAHLEQGLTFMGCVVESVRSEIADFCYLEEGGDDSRWYPPILPESVDVSISDQLWSCLRRVAQEPEDFDFFDSAVKERLLWECQNGVHAAMQQDQVETYEEVQTLKEAMMLLLLGFPAIRIERSKTPVDRKDRTTMYPFFYVRPVGGPQDLSIRVVMTLHKPSLQLKIVEGNGTVAPDPGRVIFRWQDWRDALEGRFMGKREWQVNHYMTFVSAHHTNQNISYGVKPIPIGNPEMGREVLVWEGWRPFRAGMTFFELKNSSLIIVGDTMPSERNSGRNLTSRSSSGVRSTRYPPAEVYYKASTPALSDASVFLDALLKLGPSVLGARVPNGTPRHLGPLLPPKMPTPPPTPGSASVVDTTERKEKKLGVGNRIYEDDIIQKKHPKLSPPASPQGSPRPPPSDSSRPSPSNTNSMDLVLAERLNRVAESGAMFVVAPQRSQETVVYSATGTMNESQNDGTSLLDRVQEQDPSAMHDLAKDLLCGTDKYRKNRAQALLLMERAIVIGHRIETVEMFVDTILDYGVNHGEAHNAKADVDVARALKAIRMIWRDIDSRHIVVAVRRNNTTRSKKIWKNTSIAEEVERMRKLTNLHLKLIRMKRSGAMMRDLADNLSTWGKSVEEQSAAIILYESAILANCDSKAMNELALIYAPLDPNFSLKLYQRAEKITKEMRREAITTENDPQEASSRMSIGNRAAAGNTNAIILRDKIDSYKSQSNREQTKRNIPIMSGENSV